MKKIIIIVIAAVAAIIPFQGSFALAADSFFGADATNHPFGTNGETAGVFNNGPFGAGVGYDSNDSFFGTGAHDGDTFFGSEDDECGTHLDCDNEILCDWNCPNPCVNNGCEPDPCGNGACYPQHDDSEYADNSNENISNNVNNNRNEVYITIYGQGSISGSDIDVRQLPTCNNGVDDDNDGRVDFNDSDCKVFGKENGQNARVNTAAPVFVSVAPADAREGVLYSYDANARDNDEDSLTYSLTQSPAGMTIERSSGLINWVPTSAQAGIAHSVTVSVSDGARQTIQNFQIFVERAVRAVAAQSGRSTVSEQTEGRVAGVNAVKVAQAAERSTLHAYNIRVDTDEEQNSIITWDTTEPSRGRVLYGLATRGDYNGTDFTGARQYEFSTPDSPEISTSHRVVLGQLESERVYYFRVMSFAGTQTDVSSERSFVQLPNGDTLNSDAGFASVIGTFGSFLISPWFLLLVIILIALMIWFRRRDGEIVAHAPVEVKVGGHH